MRDKFRSDLSMKIEKKEGVSISVRKYLNWPLGERFEAFYRMVQLLLEGIRIQAVEGDKSEWLMFRAYIESVEKKLERQTPPCGPSVRLNPDDFKRKPCITKPQSRTQ